MLAACFNEEDHEVREQADEEEGLIDKEADTDVACLLVIDLSTGKIL